LFRAHELTLWKTLAIVLAVALGIILVCTVLVVTGVMKLGLSLL
jgi:hypothetical protein